MSKFLSIYTAIIFIAVALLITYSERGIMDVIHLGERIKQAESRIIILEKQNQTLRRQLDLLLKGEVELFEARARDLYGWAGDDEKIYLEPEPLSTKK